MVDLNLLLFKKKDEGPIGNKINKYKELDIKHQQKIDKYKELDIKRRPTLDPPPPPTKPRLRGAGLDRGPKKSPLKKDDIVQKNKQKQLNKKVTNLQGQWKNLKDRNSNKAKQLKKEASKIGLTLDQD